MEGQKDSPGVKPSPGRPWAPTYRPGATPEGKMALCSRQSILLSRSLGDPTGQQSSPPEGRHPLQT